MRAEMEDGQSRHMRLLRLSVCEGIHTMYTSYSSRKWAQVQTTARQIKSRLETGSEETEGVPVTTEMTPVTAQDKAASQWTCVEMETCRANYLYKVDDIILILNPV